MLHLHCSGSDCCHGKCGVPLMVSWTGCVKQYLFEMLAAIEGGKGVGCYRDIAAIAGRSGGNRDVELNYIKKNRRYEIINN